MAEQVQDTEVFTDEQASMEEDFFSDNVEYVSEDGTPLKAEDAPNAETATKEEKPVINAEEPVVETPQGTTEPTAPKTGIMADFFDESGMVKDESLDFFAINKENAFEYKRPEPVKPSGIKSVEQDNRPEWKRQLDEVREYEKTLRTGTLSPLEKAYQMIQSGQDPIAALNNVYMEQKSIVDSHLEEKRFEMEEARLKRENEARSSQMEAQQLKPKSDANFATIASELGGVEKAQELLFGANLGGPIINFLFDMVNPDSVNLPADKAAQELNNFWTKLSSNENSLRMVTELAKARLQKQMWPDIVKRIRSGATSQATQNAEGKMSQQSSMGLASAPEAPDALNEYFGGQIDHI